MPEQWSLLVIFLHWYKQVERQIKTINQRLHFGCGMNFLPSIYQVLYTRLLKEKVQCEATRDITNTGREKGLNYACHLEGPSIFAQLCAIRWTMVISSLHFGNLSWTDSCGRLKGSSLHGSAIFDNDQTPLAGLSVLFSIYLWQSEVFACILQFLANLF